LVTVKVDYKRGDSKDVKKYATVTAGKKNVAFDLLQLGYVEVARHGSNGERSPFYDKLTKLDNDAKDRKKGIHGNLKDATENYDVKDLTMSKGFGKDKGEKDNTEENQIMFNMMKDRKQTAIIDKVLSGSRFKILLPKQNCLVIFSLSGLSTNVGNKEDKEKPFASESLNFSIKRLANKEVDVIVDRCDKNGNFLGQIFLGEENYSESILKEGLAFISHGIANRFKNYNELVLAENVAKSGKKKIFSLSEEKIYGNDTKSKKIEKKKHFQRMLNLVKVLMFFQ